MGENLKFGPTENGRLTKEDGLKSKNARKQTHFKIQFYNGKKVTSFKIFTLKFSLSPNAQLYAELVYDNMKGLGKPYT